MRRRRRAARPRARATSRAARSPPRSSMRTAKSSLGPPTRVRSQGPPKIVFASASSSGLSAANVASLFGAASRSFTRNSSSLVANLTLPVSARSRSSSEAACSVRRANRPAARPAPARALAVVEQARPAFALVEEVVRTVADQHHARPLGHVPVVGDVDGQLGQRALLDPAVKYRDRRLHVERARRLRRQVNLELQLVCFHGVIVPSGAARPRGQGPWASFRAEPRRV